MFDEEPLADAVLIGGAQPERLARGLGKGLPEAMELPACDGSEGHPAFQGVTTIGAARAALRALNATEVERVANLTDEVVAASICATHRELTAGFGPAD
jgi:hypothetical protein